jgi:hypothetical protein
MFKRLFASRNRPCFANPSRWDTLVYDLSGNRLEITLPPQDYDFPEDDNGKRFNLFDQSVYDYDVEPDRNNHTAHQRGISKDAIVRRNWDTYGSFWLGHPLGKLQCAAVICDTSRMPSQLNCFNPEQMERLIIHALYYSKGPGFGDGDGSNEFDTPVNWQIKQLHGVEWVYFESWKRRPEWVTFTHSTYGCHFSSWLVTPLFANKYMLLSFSAIGSLPAEPSNSLMHQRIQQIIPGIKLSFSPEAQKQRTEAQYRFPNAKYSSARTPEAWKYYGSYREGDYAKGEKPHIFEGPCSPPPELY